MIGIGWRPGRLADAMNCASGASVVARREEHVQGEVASEEDRARETEEKPVELDLSVEGVDAPHVVEA